MTIAPEPIVGRYYPLEVQGRAQRIYVETSGDGAPVVCLHTAGADARQYRHLQNDPELLADFRIVAFDLPWHGKSLPPAGWWQEEYLLTVERYTATIMAVIEALALERPIVMGCSMGGSVVLELARSHADRLGGVIGFSGAAKVEGRFQDWPLAPDINANQVVPSWTAALMAPQGPEAARREVWWIYSQGGPGIYRGDTYFYSDSFDLRGHEHEIDTRACPVTLLTGEYDFACSPEETEATLARIPGAEGGRMAGIGHFPISENYPLCKTYFEPALRRMARLRAQRLAR